MDFLLKVFGNHYILVCVAFLLATAFGCFVYQVVHFFGQWSEDREEGGEV